MRGPEPPGPRGGRILGTRGRDGSGRGQRSWDCPHTEDLPGLAIEVLDSPHWPPFLTAPCPPCSLCRQLQVSLSSLGTRQGQSPRAVAVHTALLTPRLPVPGRGACGSSPSCDCPVPLYLCLRPHRPPQARMRAAPSARHAGPSPRAEAAGSPRPRRGRHSFLPLTWFPASWRPK